MQNYHKTRLPDLTHHTLPDTPGFLTAIKTTLLSPPLSFPSPPFLPSPTYYSPPFPTPLRSLPPSLSHPPFSSLLPPHLVSSSPTPQLLLGMWDILPFSWTNVSRTWLTLRTHKHPAALMFQDSIWVVRKIHVLLRTSFVFVVNQFSVVLSSTICCLGLQAKSSIRSDRALWKNSHRRKRMVVEHY